MDNLVNQRICMMSNSNALPPATIIINFHREGVYAHKTLLGFLRIREYSASFGNRVDLIYVLDNSDVLTRQIVTNFLKEYGTKYDQMVETSYASLSAARNAGIDQTKTEYVGFNDGDDFFSANRVEEMLKVQLASKAPLLCFPEKIISFGIKSESYNIPFSQNISKAQMINLHYWTYATFSQTDLYNAIPFNELVGKNTKLAYEDWDFNLRCIENDVKLAPIKDTYFFYRRSKYSMLIEHNAFQSFTPAFDFFNNINL